MDRRVQEVIRLVESDERYLRLRNPADELAKSIGLSGSRLRCIIKAETGLGFGRFLAPRRLARATKLLETSHLRLKQVAGEIGMSEAHFVRIFKRANGVTPGRFRLRGG
jgi:transcriptional regulator GlxA family with amidase domain